jgi:intein-encoded DNA endonuclease-like protein
MLEEFYLTKKLSTLQIAKIFHVSRGAVWAWLKKYKMPIRRSIITESEEKKIVAFYVNELKVDAIIKLTRRSKSKIYQILKKHDVLSKRPLLKQLADKKTLSLLYLKHGLTCLEISRKLGISKVSAFRLLKAHGIKTRSYIVLPNFIPNKKLAYVLGVLKGDGCVSKIKRKNSYVISLAVQDREFAEEFSRASKYIGLHPKIFDPAKYKVRLYRVVSYSKFFGEWYRLLSEKNMCEVLKKPMLMKAFIRGFYDSEGYLNRFKNKYGIYLRIRLVNTNIGILNLVKTFLERLGFRPMITARKKVAYQKQAYDLTLSRKSEVKRFIYEIGSSIPRKVEIGK